MLFRSTREYMALKQIEKVTKGRIWRKQIPSVDDIFLSKYKGMLVRVKETLEQDDYKRFVPLAEGLDEEYNLVDVAAALMNMVYSKEVGRDCTDDCISQDSFSRAGSRFSDNVFPRKKSSWR